MKTKGFIKIPARFLRANDPLACSIYLLLSLKGKLRTLPEAGLKFTVDGQDEVDLKIRKIVEKNGRILWVSPVRPSLESIFNAGPELPARNEGRHMQSRRD